MSRDVKCEKCSEDLGYGWDGKRYEVKMVGGHHALICTSCRNLWSEHLKTPGPGKDAFMALKVLDTKLHSINLVYDTTGGDKLMEVENLLHPLMEKRVEHEDVLREEAKTWLADKLVATP